MARKKAEIDTGQLLHALDMRHEELLRNLEDLNLQIEQALCQLRPSEPRKVELKPESAPPLPMKGRRRSAPAVEAPRLIDGVQQPQS